MATFIFLLVFCCRHATNQGFGVILKTGDHKNIALDFTSRERHPYHHRTNMKILWRLDTLNRSRLTFTDSPYFRSTHWTSYGGSSTVSCLSKIAYIHTSQKTLPKSHTTHRIVHTAIRTAAGGNYRTAGLCIRVVKKKLFLLFQSLRGVFYAFCRAE